MRLTVDGKETFAGTGGRDFDPALPAVVFLHGAGLDHSCGPCSRARSRIADLPRWRRLPPRPLRRPAAFLDRRIAE